MFDTNLVPFAYGFLVVAAIALALGVAGVVLIVRDLRATAAAPVLVSDSGSSERGYSRAA